MNYRFHTCDVFTRNRFGGNPLAVLPDAEGLSSGQMQQIAREFNYSETTFVLPPEQGNTRKVRIFTPAREVPFAGHPNIGTAFVLAATGALGPVQDGLTAVFEEEAGLVPVTIAARESGRLWCELEAPQDLALGETIGAELAASALSLESPDIATTVHPPRPAGVGLPFLIVELVNLDALGRARFNMGVMETFRRKGIPSDILLYTREAGEADIRARMFAPLDGVPEDPATGSANCALAALLSHCDAAASADFSFRIVQGVEMGRPSVLEARTRKREGAVTATLIGGDCVLVSEGVMTVG
jgi:trans-2,3-dihydro-3-hydroxyanthranilate isomerase